MLITTRRRLHRWRGRLALLWALLVLGALVAAAHVPANSSNKMDGDEHMGGAAICLAVLSATGVLAALLGRPVRLRRRPARRIGSPLAALGPTQALPPPARAGPLALQVLRL